MSAAAPTLFSAAELAALALPGLPTTARGINLWRQRTGSDAVEQGHRKLISVDQLPEAARLALLDRQALRLSPAPAPSRRGRGRPKGTDFFTRNPDIADAVTAYLTQHQFAATTILEFLAADFSTLPHIRQLRRFMARIEEERVTMLTAMRDPDRAKSAHRLALGRADGDVTYAHQLWELDTTKADVMTAGGRKMILGLIDRWSRRVCFLVANSESAQSVRALLFKAMTLWGVTPGTIVVDNGSGYINATVLSACELLGIEHKPCPPGSPERKPFVERLFGTFTRERLVMLQGFTGHNVAQAQQLRARARKTTGRAEITGNLSPEDLQQILDNWTAGTYETRIHSGINAAPLTRAMASPFAARPAPSEAVLRTVLTAFVGNLVVGKRGLRWKNGRYWCAELVEWIARPVHVRRDEDDLGALHVFDGEGHYIGLAVNHERAGLSEQQFAMAARAHQRALEKEQRAEARALQSRFTMEKAQAHVLRSDAEGAGKLAVLPAPPNRVAAPEPASPPQSAAILPMTTRATGDMAERASRARALIEHAASGHDVPAQKIAWASAFLESPAFKAWAAHDDHLNQAGGNG